jgi:hypothetical protein
MGIFPTKIAGLIFLALLKERQRSFAAEVCNKSHEMGPPPEPILAESLFRNDPYFAIFFKDRDA